MKTAFIFSILFMYITYNFAQIKFEYFAPSISNLEDPITVFTHSMEHTNHGFYCSGIESFEQNNGLGFGLNSYIHKLDDHGFLTNYVKLGDVSTNVGVIYSKQISNSSDLYVACLGFPTQGDTNNIQTMTFYLYILDENLNVKSFNSYPLLGKLEEYDVKTYTMKNGNELISIISVNSSAAPILNAVIVNQEGKLVTSKSIESEYFSNRMMLLEKINGNGYYLVGENLVSLDSDFEIENNVKYMGFQNPFIMPYGNGYLVSYTENFRDLKISMFDEDFVLQNGTVLLDVESLSSNNMALDRDGKIMVGSITSDEETIKIFKISPNFQKIENFIIAKDDLDYLVINLNMDLSKSNVLISGAIDNNTIFGYVVYIGENDFTLKTKNIVENQIMIYPNPSNGILNLYNTNSKVISNCVIKSLDGRIVARNPITQTSTTMDLSHLSNGLYLIELNTIEGKKEIFKWMKVE